MIFFNVSRTALVLASMTLSGTTRAFSAQIALTSQSVAPGATIQSQVSFASPSISVSGVQFDLQYDNAAMSLTATLGDSGTAAGKSMFSVDLAPNKKRFLIIGLNQASIPDGILLTLSVNIKSTASAGVYGLMFSNMGGTDPKGNPVVVTGSDGAITVSAGTAGLDGAGVVCCGPGSILPGRVPQQASDFERVLRSVRASTSDDCERTRAHPADSKVALLVSPVTTLRTLGHHSRWKKFRTQ